MSINNITSLLSTTISTGIQQKLNGTSNNYPLCHPEINHCKEEAELSTLANILAVLIIIANISNITVICHGRELRESIQGTCMLNVSVSDLMIGMVSCATSNCYIINRLQTNSVACKLIAAQFMMSAGCSMELITMLTYDRYSAIVEPFKYLGESDLKINIFDALIVKKTPCDVT